MTSNDRPIRTIDFAGLGIPPGRYALPDFGALRRTGDDTREQTLEEYQRLQQHFEGRVPLSDLPPADVDFLRAHFLEQVTERREQAIEYFNRRVPRRYATAHPDEQAATWAKSVASDPFSTKSLLLIGPTGTGKTYRAYAALRAVANTGSSVRWLAFTSADLYAHLRPHNGQDSEAAFEKVADAPLLLLDDLGAAKLSEWTEEITYRLINHRWEQCLPGIYVSNLRPSELADRLGERVTSRLVGMCDRIAVKGEDRRKGGAA